MTPSFHSRTLSTREGNCQEIPTNSCLGSFELSGSQEQHSQGFLTVFTAMWGEDGTTMVQYTAFGKDRCIRNSLSSIFILATIIIGMWKLSRLTSHLYNLDELPAWMILKVELGVMRIGVHVNTSWTHIWGHILFHHTRTLTVGASVKLPWYNVRVLKMKPF